MALTEKITTNDIEQALDAVRFPAMNDALHQADLHSSTEFINHMNIGQQQKHYEHSLTRKGISMS